MCRLFDGKADPVGYFQTYFKICTFHLQASKANVTEVQNLACRCFRLNSFQMTALLSQEKIPKNLVDTAIRMAESVADELARGDGREVNIAQTHSSATTIFSIIVYLRLHWRKQQSYR